MFQDRCYDRDNDMTANFFGDNNQIMNEMNMTANTNTEFDGAMQPAMDMPAMGGSCPQPIAEPMKERCVHRNIYHEVPHVCPIRTRIINHHIYRHTYRPEYSCCEENVVSNVQCGSCNQFR